MQPPVNPEASGGQHQEDHNNVLSGRIIVYGQFHHNKFILL